MDGLRISDATNYCLLAVVCVTSTLTARGLEVREEREATLVVMCSSGTRWLVPTRPKGAPGPEWERHPLRVAGGPGSSASVGMRGGSVGLRPSLGHVRASSDGRNETPEPSLSGLKFPRDTGLGRRNKTQRLLFSEPVATASLKKECNVCPIRGREEQPGTYS